MTPTTSDGVALEAELSRPAVAVAGAVVCHPHPRYGGNMHATLVAVLFDVLPEAGIACLRFNFRGVGGSTGAYDGGRGERLDVAAAAAALAGEAQDLPIWLVGWSFGADVALAGDAPGVAGWIAVAPPLALVEPGEMVAPGDPRPTVLLVPEHDMFRGPASAAAEVASWPVAPVLETLPAADHFLGGHAHEAAARVRDHILGIGGPGKG